MKKQLLNELEKEAPFRQSLKNDILKVAYEKKRRQWKIWSVAGTVAVAIIAFLFINLYRPNLNQFEDVLIAENKAADSIKEILTIEGSKLNGRFFQLSDDEQLFLTSIFNTATWEPIGEEEIGYKQLELQVTIAGDTELQPLVIHYKKQPEYTTLYSIKGKLTLNANKMDQFNQLLNHAFAYTRDEKAWYLDDVISYQPQQSWMQNDPNKVSELKEILSKAIFSIGTVIDTKHYPDGYIDLFTSSENIDKYRLNYWVERNKIIIDARTGVGEITGESMYQFIKFLIEEGALYNGVRSVSEEDIELYQSLLSKLENLPSQVSDGSVQTPNYILNVNRKAYFLTILEDRNELLYDFLTKYQLSDFENEINALIEISNNELSNFMLERTWEKSKKKLVRQPDFTFVWNEGTYRVWINDDSKTGEINVENEWGSLTEKEIEILEQLVRELQ